MAPRTFIGEPEAVFYRFNSVRKSLLTISGILLLILLPGWFMTACKKEPGLKGLTPLNPEYPATFPPPQNLFENNPLSAEAVELGRKLFYDPALSADKLTPCSSCHQQIAAFGTYEHDRSHGVFGTHTLRNAPPLFNLAWSPAFHWDGEFTRLEDEFSHPLTGSTEMGETYQQIIRYLENDPAYRKAFKEVFRSPFIQPAFIHKALAQFTGIMISASSKYDQMKAGAVQFTAQEQAGYQLYSSNCAGCHPEPLFTDYSFRNTGLPVDPLLNDFGKMRISGNPADSLKFRVPSLRNTYISANYMHDGRFNTLQQCLNHYRSNVQQSSTLDPLLENGIPLTNTESTALISFLRTLTDSVFIRDPRFKKPD